MSEFFLTPRLLITEYYDSLINQIAIYTEELIKKVEKEILQKLNRLNSSINFSTKAEKAMDKLNKARDKSIDAIRKVQNENLDFYNANKEKLKLDRTNVTKENKLEELKSQLFSNRFCFLLDFEKNRLYSIDREIESLFKLRTVITDFYLRESDIDYIRKELEYYEKPYKKIFDQRLLVANQLAKYLRNERNELGVIQVKQNSLFKFEHISVQFNRKFDELDFRFDIDFSAIRYLNISLNYDRISDFGAFANLEYLSILNVMLCERPFENLHKLVKIQIHCCDLSQFDFDSLNSNTSLQIIAFETYRNEINRQCLLKIDLNELINLKSLDLELHKDSNFELIRNSSNRLTSIRLRHKSIDFSSDELDFPELKCLNISNADLSKQLSQQSFNGMGSLIELNLCNTNLTNVDFIHTDRLGNLEILNLSFNRISGLKKAVFSKLKSLKSLELEHNEIRDLVPGDFDGLECLEQLNVKSNCFRIRSIDKAVFDGLKCLKCLGIEDYTVTNSVTNYHDLSHLKREGLLFY